MWFSFPLSLPAHSTHVYYLPPYSSFMLFTRSSFFHFLHSFLFQSLLPQNFLNIPLPISPLIHPSHTCSHASIHSHTLHFLFSSFSQYIDSFISYLSLHLAILIHLLFPPQPLLRYFDNPFYTLSYIIYCILIHLFLLNFTQLWFILEHLVHHKGMLSWRNHIAQSSPHLYQNWRLI